MGLIHARNLSKQRGIRLGLACSRPPHLTKVARLLHADAMYSSYDSALLDPDVYAVVIATSPPSHPDLIARAATAKKHIFSEKPLGYTSSSIMTALSTVKSSGVRFMSGFMRRWDRDYCRAREQLQGNKLGRINVIKCTSGDPEYPEKYHRGGAKHAILKDLAVHDIDLARWLTGSEVKRVFVMQDALTYPTLTALGDADVVVAVLEMECGTKVLVHLSRALGFGYEVTTQVYCKNGRLDIGELKKRAVTLASEKENKTNIAWDFGERFEEAFEREMAGFVELVCKQDEEVEDWMKNEMGYASAEDGLAATVVAEALVESATSGEAVEVKKN